MIVLAESVSLIVGQHDVPAMWGNLKKLLDFRGKISMLGSFEQSFVFQLLDAAFANPEQARFMVRERIEEFRGSGGVSSFCWLRHLAKK